MNNSSPKRSPFRLITLVAILFAILFFTFCPNVEMARGEARLVTAYNDVREMAAITSAMEKFQSADPDDKLDPWGQRYRIVELGQVDSVSSFRVVSSGPNQVSPPTGFDHDDIYSDMPISPMDVIHRTTRRQLIFVLSLPVVWLFGSIGYLLMAWRSPA